MANAIHLAEAFQHVASIDHYMVGIERSGLTLDDLQAAEQILIAAENATTDESEAERITLALDLCEYEIRRFLQRQSAGKEYAS